MEEDRHEALEVLTTYSHSAEAGVAQHLLEEAGIPTRLSGEAAANNLSYFGTAIGGVRLLVREKDLSRAAELLSKGHNGDEGEFLAQGEANGWWDKEESHDDDDDGGLVRREASPELLRAYRASLLCLILFPFGASLYPLYLILRHRLFLPDRGGSDWRFLVAMVVSTFGACMMIMIWRGVW